MVAGFWGGEKEDRGQDPLALRTGGPVDKPGPVCPGVGKTEHWRGVTDRAPVSANRSNGCQQRSKLASPGRRECPVKRSCSMRVCNNSQGGRKRGATGVSAPSVSRASHLGSRPEGPVPVPLARAGSCGLALAPNLTRSTKVSMRTAGWVRAGRKEDRRGLKQRAGRAKFQKNQRAPSGNCVCIGRNLERWVEEEHPKVVLGAWENGTVVAP